MWEDYVKGLSNFRVRLHTVRFVPTTLYHICKIQTMNKSELWDKLEADHESMRHDILHYVGANGYDEFKNRVMGRLEDDMPYGDACGIFKEENEKV